MTNPQVVFTKPGEIEVQDRPVPEVRAGQVLIQTHVTLVSIGTELTILKEEFPQKGFSARMALRQEHSRSTESAWAVYGKFPFYPGYNNVGLVVEAGEGVDRQWVGQWVAVGASHAAYVAADTSHLLRVPEGVDSEQAAFFMLAQIAMNGVRRGQVTWAEAAVVFGAGLVGYFAAWFCRMAGARPVFSVDVSDTRLALMPEGVIRINADREKPLEVVVRTTDGRMADVIFEVTGNHELIPREFQVLRPQGRAVILSGPRGPSLFDFHDLCNSPSYTIIGAHNASHPPEETPLTPWSGARHGALFMDLLAKREMDLSGMVTHRAPFSQAPDIYRMLVEDRSQALGVIIQWNGAAQG